MAITRREVDLVLEHEHVRWTGKGAWGVQETPDAPEEK